MYYIQTIKSDNRDAQTDKGRLTTSGSFEINGANLCIDLH